jgi:hypothetical protein
MSRVQIPVVAQDAAGNAVSGAEITIVNRQTGQAPVVYSTETGGSARALPLTTAVNGRPPESWVDRAAYQITVTAAAIGTDVLAWDGAAARDASVDVAWLTGAALLAPGAAVLVTRALNTTYQPSTTRPVLVVASIVMDTPANSYCYVYARCSAGTPATSVIAQELQYNYTAARILNYRTITFLVPAGFYYMLEGIIEGGPAVLNINRVMEQAL